MDSYCRYCNTKIWREYRMCGIKCVPKYYSYHVLTSVGKIDQWQITHCPGCGGLLNETVISNNAHSLFVK